MADHRKRFERWRKHLPENASYLVEQVLARVLPEFEKRRFRWYPDFAAGDPEQVGPYVIPLQRREGDVWPTVQISFNPRGRPALSVYFAELPRVCRRWDDGYHDVPREAAMVFEGPACFALAKDRKSSARFGYNWVLVSPRRRLDAEVERLASLLPGLFDLFDRGIPREWLRGGLGHVTDHVIRISSRMVAFEDPD